jgi:hypothetical protein
VVVAHEQQLLRSYIDQLCAALSERGLHTAAEACGRPQWLACHLALEVVAYTQTALPQLLDGLTPQLAAENAGK